jgi:hypothetical protein
MPLRHVLLRARSTTSTLASKSIDRDGEEARVFVRLFYLDRVQVCVEARISSMPRVKHQFLKGKTYSQKRRPVRVCQHDLLSLSFLFAAADCGTGIHRMICRSGGAGVWQRVG